MRALDAHYAHSHTQNGKGLEKETGSEQSLGLFRVSYWHRFRRTETKGLRGSRPNSVATIHAQRRRRRRARRRRRLSGRCVALDASDLASAYSNAAASTQRQGTPMRDASSANTAKEP